MINILLCTYNGEHYLRPQLDSLLQQTYIDFRICVHDDGSTDNTPAILEEYERLYPNRLLLMNTRRKHLGYPDCFWALLRDCPAADAYAWCDQDDVWAPEKLKRASAMLLRFPKNEPVLYIHDYQVCDAALHPLSVHTIPDLSALPSERLLFYSYAEGISMVFNNALKDLLLSYRPEGKNLCHDEWTLWSAYFHGRILHDPKILAKYRRHDDTVTSTGANTKGMIHAWLTNEIAGPAFEEKCRRIALFAKTDTKISQKDRETWLLLSGETNTPACYLKRLFYPHRLKPTLSGELAQRLLFLKGEAHEKRDKQ